MHGYPVMQVVQYSVPPCSWPPVDSHRPSQPTSASQRSGIRKYVVWCLICGGLSCLLGIMFLGVYFLVRSYTSTIGYFETVPTFVPATLLMLTGLCIISLARRRNRYSYLIKLSGACGLSSALTCALVTVTTTVIHMSRLQALRECEYTRKTRTCTCYSVETHAMQDNSRNDEGYRFVFDSADECTVVHNALYSCLRAIFGISVAGVLVAVFSCMLVYQLLSHERKKMIWEQLELRRRQAYGRQSPPGWPSLANGPSIIGTPRNGACRCCEQCHSHRNMMQSNYSWDNEGRFWSPNGYYTQGADDHMIVSRMVNQNAIQTQRPGWSWPRFPWQRNDSSQRFRQTPSSPDSQYGFSSNMSRIDNANLMQSYTLINNPHHFSIWGPPPPYSDPNSPVHRNRMYSYAQCQPINDHSGVMLQPIQAPPNQTTNCPTTMDLNRPIIGEINHHSIEQICATPTTHRTHRIKNRLNAFKAKDSNDSGTLSDSDTQRESNHSNHSNTLPFRKARKKIENGVKSIGPHQTTQRINVQRVFSSTQIDCNRPHDNIPSCSTTNHIHGKLNGGPSNGVENSGFQSIEDDRIIINMSPPEMYTTDNNEQTIITNNNNNNNNNRDRFSRGRLQFTNGDHENINGSYNANHPPLPSITQRNKQQYTSNSSHSLPKDLTRYSICSVESGEKTDYTDLSPMTPSTPYANKESAANAITLAFQREIKQQQQQQQQQQITTPHNNIYKDHSEAGSSNSKQMYTARYFDNIDHKRDVAAAVAAAAANVSMRAKNVQEIHLRPTLQHGNVVTNQNIPSIDSGAQSLDNLNASITMLQKCERRSVYQRPTYSFASAHNTPRHNHNVKHNLLTITPKKRNVYATQSLGNNSNVTDMTIDLMRLTNMRKDNNNKTDDSNVNNIKSERERDRERTTNTFDVQNKASDDNNIWPGHSSSDVRL